MKERIRIGLGIFVILLAPVIFFLMDFAEQEGIDLTKGEISKETILILVLGKWGVPVFMAGAGIWEIRQVSRALKAKKKATLQQPQG